MQVESRILEAFPQDQFFSEETPASEAPYDIESEYVWVIDPGGWHEQFCPRNAGLRHFAGVASATGIPSTE